MSCSKFLGAQAIRPRNFDLFTIRSALTSEGSSKYGSLLIPVIMSKLSQVARNIAREVWHWQMSDLLEVIRQEVEAREIRQEVKINVNVITL